MRGLFLSIQLLDGYKNTNNVSGKLIELFQQAAFAEVAQRQTFSTHLWHNGLIQCGQTRLTRRCTRPPRLRFATARGRVSLGVGHKGAWDVRPSPSKLARGGHRPRTIGDSLYAAWGVLPDRAGRRGAGTATGASATGGRFSATRKFLRTGGSSRTDWFSTTQESSARHKSATTDWRMATQRYSVTCGL